MNAAPQVGQLKWALTLAEEHALPVFPLNRWKMEDGERVYCKAPLTKNGFYDATTNVEQINSWWRSYPDALIGVPTGVPSKLFVIDVDPEGLADYAENAQFFAPGRVQKTVRGFHLIYTHPGALGCTGKKWRPGYDTRGDGGYVVWWESEGFHCTGAMNDIGPLPELVLASLRRYESQRTKTRKPSSGGIGPDRSKDLLARVGKDVRNGLADYEIHARHEGHPHVADQADGARAIQRCIDLVRSELPPAIASPALNAEPAPVPLIPGTDMANARRMHLRHGANLHYTVERGWLVWSGRHWQVDDKAVGVAHLAKESAESMLDEIRGAVDQKQAFKDAKAAAQKRAIEAAIWLTRSEPGVYQQLITFDTDPMILNVGNGIIDLTTGELGPHEQDARCTMLAGCDYDAHAQAPRWRQFVGEVCLENVELMDYVQRMCGYLLTASVQEHCLFFLHGGGRNGKSVLVETIMKVMGDYACAAEPEMLMTRKQQGIPNDVARLRGKRAVFLNETNQGHRFDEAKLKNLTGGDKLNARFMREEFFDFSPTHKLCLRGNHKPTVNGTDEGIWSRLRLVPFNLRLTPAEIDMALPAALACELPGILAWCVQGCLLWQQQGLATPQVILDALTEYRAESDTMGRFIDECCELNPNGRVVCSALFNRYRDFCTASSERFLSAKDFPAEMERRGFNRVKSDGIKKYQGIELKHIPFEEPSSWFKD